MTSPDTPSDTSLYNNPTLSDVKIRQIYNGEVKEYFAHKAVLCANSKWFLKAFTGEFKEAHENTIDLHDDSPKLFEDMLRFCYTQKYDCSREYKSHYDQTSFERFCLDPICLHALADKYLMRALQSRVSAELTKSLNYYIDEDQCKQMMKLHYSSCAMSSSAVGQVLTTFVVRDKRSWFKDLMSSFELLEDYASFGADMFRAFKEAGKLA